MKRHVLWAIFAVVAIGLTVTANVASAAPKGSKMGTTRLWPPADSPFPNATGRVTTTCEANRDPWSGNLYYIVEFSLEAYGLAPDTFYYFYPNDPDYKYGMYYGGGPFITDENGNYSSGSAPFSARMPEKPPIPAFWVWNSTTGVMVLTSSRH